MVWARPDLDWNGVFGQRYGKPVLLRNDEIIVLDPTTPPRPDILPLDPTDDHYLDAFESGDLDPTPSASPLVFYELYSPISTLKLTKSGGSVRNVY